MGGLSFLPVDFISARYIGIHLLISEHLINCQVFLAHIRRLVPLEFLFFHMLVALLLVPGHEVVEIAYVRSVEILVEIELLLACLLCEFAF